MEEAAGEFVVDQKIGRLAPVNARHRPAHDVAAVAVGSKRRVSKAATASVTITNRGRLRAVCANKAASVVAIQPVIPQKEGQQAGGGHDQP